MTQSQLAKPQNAPWPQCTHKYRTVLKNRVLHKAEWYCSLELMRDETWFHETAVVPQFPHLSGKKLALIVSHTPITVFSITSCHFPSKSLQHQDRVCTTPTFWLVWLCFFFFLHLKELVLFFTSSARAGPRSFASLSAEKCPWGKRKFMVSL